MKKLILLASLALAACASDPSTGQPAVPDFTQTQLATITHDDLVAASNRAKANGFPARAQMWTALDGLLTAREQQANACAQAIAAMLPKQPDAKFAGAADAAEAAAELVSTFSISPQVKANCTLIPIPTLPGLPALPR